MQRLLALVVLSGCVSNTFEVRRSALVPALTAPVRSGRPIDGRVQVAAHAGTNLVEVDPEANGTSGMYVARTTLGLAARFRVGRVFDIGPAIEAGVGGDSMPAGPDLPPRPDGNAIGTGVSMQLAPRFDDERIGLAVAFDLLFFSIPVREEWWCLDCGTTTPQLDHVEATSTFLPVYGLSLLPSFAPDDTVTLFGGMTVRNQPAIRRSETVTTTIAGSGDSGEEVGVGPLGIVASVGGELHLGAGARVLLQASQPLTQTPAQYGPSITGGFSWSFGDPAP